MIITWDEPKRIANIEKHGLDFADLTSDFIAGAMIRHAKQNRFQALGYLADNKVSVICAALGGEVLSVISMRPASLRERSLL